MFLYVWNADAKEATFASDRKDGWTRRVIKKGTGSSGTRYLGTLFPRFCQTRFRGKASHLPATLLALDTAASKTVNSSVILAPASRMTFFSSVMVWPLRTISAFTS